MHRTQTITVPLTLILLTGILLVPALYAAREGGEGSEYRMKPGRHTGRSTGMHGFVSYSLHHLVGHAKELGLSEEQTNKIKGIAKEFQKTHIRGEADWKLAEVEVQTLIHEQKSDLPAIEKAMRKAADT
jgi:hypothetical protein